MLEDRDYMRQPDIRHGMSMTARLTIILVAAFAFQCIDDAYLKTGADLKWLALTPEGVRHGWIWQLITFQFLHGSLVHILCNLIGFWWLGHFVENVLGPKRFLVALFGCGIMGGILQGILMLLFPGLYGLPVVGASAGVSGLLAIFCLLERDSQVRFNLILPMPAITLLWIWGGISLFFTLVPSFLGGNVAHAAHLGGLLGGIAWVKLGWHHDYVQLPWERWMERLKGSGEGRVRKKSASVSRRSPKAEAAPNPDDSALADVDAILDKINARGINSLTAREREILEAARKKMAQR